MDSISIGCTKIITMKYTIENMKQPLTFMLDDRKTISINGYAFIDECGGTIIIVYGEGYRDSMSKYLTEDGDALNLKYVVVNL
jgi:hypothetical protein